MAANRPHLRHLCRIPGQTGRRGGGSRDKRGGKEGAEESGGFVEVANLGVAGMLGHQDGPVMNTAHEIAYLE